MQSGYRSCRILAREQQRGPVTFRGRIGEAIGEIELGRMPPPLPVAGKRAERGFGLPVGDRDDADARGPKERADIRLGFLDAGVPFSAETERRLEIATGEVIGARARSSTSARASASASRVRMATMAEASTNITPRR